MTTKLIACTAALALATLTSAASAVTLYVANNGVDGGACGTQDSPCRSITRAIAQASAGDTIEVGPGLYGDIDHDGAYDFPGDEQPVFDGCPTLLRVNKAVAIVSRAGASQTIIAPRFVDERYTFCSLVRIEAPGVVFGEKNRGFTLTSSNGTDVIDALQHHVGAAGIRATAEANGVVIAGNFLTVNRIGVEVFAADATVSDNVFQSNFGAIQTSAARTAIIGNAIEASQDGIYVSGNRATIAGNMVCGNLHSGVLLLSGVDHVVSGNNLLGNGRGITLGPSVSAAINGNNIYGNASVAAPFNGGLVSSSSAAIDSSDNYWGVPFGPGSDPADADYSFGSGSVASFPAAPAPFAIAIAPVK